MQATRALRIASTRTLCEGPTELVAKANPALTKVWKSYTYTRHQRIQQLSPFEVDVLGPLFRNIGDKIKHKVQDNAVDVVPPIVFFIGLVSLVKWKRKQIVLEHRD